MSKRDFLKATRLVAILFLFPITLSCVTNTAATSQSAETTFFKEPPQFYKGFATPVSYKDGKHPGIDYAASPGTPIIASADGVVRVILDESGKKWTYGLFIIVEHGEYNGKPFRADYGHLSRALVAKGDTVKRGQLIGIVARSTNDAPDHLHFGLHLGKTGIENHYDPKDFWLGGTAQCYDSDIDYSKAKNTELTHPIACGKYGKFLLETDVRLKK